MADYKRNISKTRNTEQQMGFYEALEQFLEQSGASQLDRMSTFPVYTPRQIITAFLEKYEVFKLAKDVPGCIVECGVAGGLGLMTFAHLCSIFEPYHYTRRVIGFDTFEGFAGISDKDMTSRSEHMAPGGLRFDSFDELTRAVEIHDMNRALGHLPKVELVKGDLSQTLPRYIEDNPSLVVAMLYMDVDLYRPTLDALTLLRPRIPKGGIIVFDEINHSDYPGETLAAMEALGLPNLPLKRLPISSNMSYCVVE